ncbi:MAG: trigger factor [Acidobacteriota bacterium]
MSVVLAVENVGPCRKQLKIEVPAPAVEAELRKVVEQYSRQARVPGFRRGKIPASLIRQRFRDDIRQEVIERLLPRFWQEASTESALDTLTAPSVEEVGELADGEPLTFTAAVDVRPEFELASLDGFDLPDRDEEPSEEELTEALDELRRQVADWVTVERPAARGDRVLAAVRELEVEEDPESEPERVQVEIGDARVWEELSLALTGLEAGQTGTFSRPEGEGDEARVRKFEVEAALVEERDLPEPTNEFAAKVGKFETIDELREQVANGVTARKREASDRQRREALMEQLVARNSFDLPEGVVNHETENILRDYAMELQRRGVDVEAAGLDWQEMGGQARPQAERRVRERLVLDAVVAAEEVAVSDEEVDGALATLARLQNRGFEELRQEFVREGRMASLRQQLQRDRAVRRLLGDGEDGAEENKA